MSKPHQDVYTICKIENPNDQETEFPLHYIKATRILGNCHFLVLTDADNLVSGFGFKRVINMPIGGVPVVDNNHLHCIKVWGAYSDEDVDLLDQFVAQRSEVHTGHLTHSIWDFRDVTSMPSIKKMAGMKSANAPYIGWVIIVGMPNKLFVFFTSVASQLFKLRVRFMESYEEATEFLQYVDSTLPSFTADDVRDAMLRARAEALLYAVPEPQGNL